MRRHRADRRLHQEAQTREWLRSVVRSGLFDADRVERELREVIGADLPHVDPGVAPAWIAEATADWHADADLWPPVTDFDRLVAAFARLDESGLRVLAGCEDHWAATAALQDLGPDDDGLLWFTPLDVWHAVDEPMLEVNIWSPDGVNQRHGSPLVVRAVTAFTAEGFEAHFDEGRLEVAARWERRPPVR